MLLQRAVGRQLGREQTMQVGKAFLKMKDSARGGLGGGSIVKSFGDEFMPAGVFFPGFYRVQKQASHIRRHTQPHDVSPQWQPWGDELGGNKGAEVAAGGGTVHEFTLMEEVDSAIDARTRFEGIACGGAKHTVPGCAPADYSSVFAVRVKSEYGARIARVHGAKEGEDDSTPRRRSTRGRMASGVSPWRSMSRSALPCSTKASGQPMQRISAPHCS